MDTDFRVKVQKTTAKNIKSSGLSVQREWSDSSAGSNTPWNEKQRAVIQSRIKKKKKKNPAQRLHLFSQEGVRQDFCICVVELRYHDNLV